uniref:Major facilitator superfamily (MFS) profile domain-containing protein n=1 Tax=Timema genevievae TaxID=629358 RepID=A0A7R9PKB3_TIMGE|nr:unnamed protein product [Timema genevievae]
MKWKCFSSNSLSLWIPDMFNNLGVYYNLHPEGPSRLCEAIGSSSANMTAPILPSSLEVIYSDLLEEPACVIQITSQTFINPMIFGVIAGAVFIPMGFVINKLGKKNTMCKYSCADMCVLVATSGAIGLYFVVTPIWAIALASMYYSFIFATVGALNSIVIDIFPTHLRAMAVSLTLMVGRIGTICGSILLATLLELSCDSIFFVYAGTALEVIFTPSPRNPLQSSYQQECVFYNQTGKEDIKFIACIIFSLRQSWETYP